MRGLQTIRAAVFSVAIFSVPVLLNAAVVVDETPAGADDLVLVDGQTAADVLVDSNDAEVVKLAAGLLADDVERVSGTKPTVRTDPVTTASTAVIVGTVGESPIIDKLSTDGKIAVADLRGKRESFAWQVVTDPVAGVHRALVIVGSDRRGTAYGITELSKQIGVSPWYWWADVPPTHHPRLRVSGSRVVESSPAIKYRGIFLNDEDWGLRPWASKTFDPQTGNIGPKTYAKIFELMLRLRLNYIWPAMHPGSAESSTFPGNSETADQWAIVTGSSHCEPMLRNNVYWPKSSGPWRFDTNRDSIVEYWKQSAVNRGGFEAVWTLGIRGIHDAPMAGPKDLHARVTMVEHTFADQRSLIDQYVTKKYGPAAQCFVPYKEVLPLYDAGMKVPDDVTLVWPDDNYGYVRRFATPAEQKRPGGSGIYYHLSYWGSPHSYLWTNSTSPALMWEELRKAYDNDSRDIWVVNVGDLKPAEIGIDFFAKLAWNPDRFNEDAQPKFIQQFCLDTFGPAGEKVADLQNAYYTLASQRKPEHMADGFIHSISTAAQTGLSTRYQALLDQETAVAASIPPDRMDAYFETVGYPARMLAATGLLYTGPREEMKKWKQYVDDQTRHYNEETAGGKWRGMMSTVPEGMSWPTEVGGKLKLPPTSASRPADPAGTTIDAAAFAESGPSTTPAAEWKPVIGLGWSGRAVTLLPALRTNQWDPADLAHAPTLGYNFNLTSATDAPILLHALPTMRMTAGGHLRVAASVDRQPVQTLDLPGGEAGDENSKARRAGVLNNRVTLELKTGPLAVGPHTLKLIAVDPGVVLDQIEFPVTTTK